jgi:hypothetical protein
LNRSKKTNKKKESNQTNKDSFSSLISTTHAALKSRTRSSKGFVSSKIIPKKFKLQLKREKKVFYSKAQTKKIHQSLNLKGGGFFYNSLLMNPTWSPK